MAIATIFSSLQHSDTAEELCQVMQNSAALRNQQCCEIYVNLDQTYDANK